MILLTRKQFREQVLKRDNNKCVICAEDAQDAHHITERRLWSDGGYYINNGASLCGNCHIKAEQTILSCEEIREAAGITELLIPLQFYRTDKIDKWGNIILPDERRIKGELFYDISVQRILKKGKVLNLFCKYIKHPRIYHLPFSEGVSKDDRILTDTKNFEGKKIIVSPKYDGENSSFYRDYLHARSIDSQSHPSQNWIRNLHNKISYEIPEDWRICGENLYAKHTIHYKNLDSYFYVFSIWNEKNECLSWDATCEWIELLGLQAVPILYMGIWNKKLLENLYQEKYNGDECEGYVVRLFSSFTYGEYKKSVAKFVAKKFGEKLAQGSSHWKHKELILNKIKKK